MGNPVREIETPTFDRLSGPVRRIVTRLVESTRFDDWADRRDAIGAAYLELAALQAGVTPNREGRTLVAAAIEKWAQTTVTDPIQAALFAISTSDAHQELAAEWFARHPQQAARFGVEVARVQ